MTVLFFCVLVAFLGWWGLLLWPTEAWRYREHFAVSLQNKGGTEDVSDITAVVPARNEEAVIGRTLAALHTQGTNLHVVVLDDQSTDATLERIRASGVPGLMVRQGKPLPPGWVGKLWALEQGVSEVSTPWILLLDADIELAPGVLPALRAKAENENWSAVSIMAAPHLETRAERCFLTAFVYFFKLLYPFSRVRRPRCSTAAAAGGCILLRRDALVALGGFSPMRSALIDDCTLARRLKEHGYRIWLGTSREVRSLRAQDTRSVARMVMRTAYTQLHCSPLLLAVTTLMMAVFFAGPWVGLLGGDEAIRIMSALALIAMMVSYLPTLRYYRQPLWRVILLTPVSLIYLFWTWGSALRDVRGVRSEWKGRRYLQENFGVSQEPPVAAPDRPGTGSYNDRSHKQNGGQ